MGVPATASEWIVDVDQDSFGESVVERSRQVPVVVDFWAEWCGPCRMLGPILEKLAQEYAGRFVLARLNVDENQQLAMQYNVQGIPAVKGFRDGAVAAEFVGALPQAAVRQFIDRLVPNPLDLKVAAAAASLEQGLVDAAEEGFRLALVEDANHPGALLGLGRALIERGRLDEALEALNRVPAATPAGVEAARLRSDIELRRAVAGESEQALRDRVASDPTDLEARYLLGSWLAVNGQDEDALQQYLEVVRRDRGAQRARAREAMVNIFARLGEVPLVRTYRNLLANALFA